MKQQLPNLLSLLRVPLAALFVVSDGLLARGAVLLVAAASDWFDGRLARATGTVSRTGGWLDPVADKIFVVAALAALTLEGGLPLWILPLLLLRDIGVVAGGVVLFVAGRPAAVTARRLGKWVTWLQFLAVGVILLRPHFATWVAVPVAVLGAVALRDYARAVRHSARVRPARDAREADGRGNG